MPGSYDGTDQLGRLAQGSPRLCSNSDTQKGLCVDRWRHVFICSVAAGKKRDFRFQLIKEAVVEEPADITPWLHHLDDAMKEKVQQLQKTRWERPCRGSSPLKQCTDLTDGHVSAVTRRLSVR